MAKKKIDSFMESFTDSVQKNQNVASYNYIKNLAATSVTDISGWDIVKVFLSDDGKNLITDKKTINRLFFDHLSKVEEKTKKEIKKLEKLKASMSESDARKEALKTDLTPKEKDLAQLALMSSTMSVTLLKIKSAEEESAQREVTYAMQNIASQYANLDSYHAQLGTAQRRLAAIKSNPNEVAEAVKARLNQIVSKGLWVNPKFVNNQLFLNTPTNIILTQVNKTANINLSVDVGQLAVKIDFNRGFQMIVIPYKNNILYFKPHPPLMTNTSYPMVTPFYHPHVNTGGGICWGNASATFIKMIANFELDKALVLLHALLHTYSETQPYVSLIDLSHSNKKLEDADIASTYPNMIRHPDVVDRLVIAQPPPQVLVSVEPNGERIIGSSGYTTTTANATAQSDFRLTFTS